MRHALLFIVILFTVFSSSCESDSINPSEDCSLRATVIDATGLDGCGYLLELDNGKILQPVFKPICGTPPLPPEVTEHPLYNFQFFDGQNVLVGYEMSEFEFNTCMRGTPVNIICIKDITEEADTPL